MGRARNGVAIGTVVSLLLIFIAILGTANEIRFQGCVARQDRISTVNVLAKKTVVAQIDECSRVPFQ